MESSFVELLVVPQDLEWPVVGRTRNGSLVVRRGAIGSIEELNGLRPGTLDHGSVVRLLTLWYRERRKLGFPRQAEFEQLARDPRVAQSGGPPREVVRVGPAG